MKIAILNEKDEQHEQKLINWLLDSDPAIRWQVLQDLCEAEASKVITERQKIATEGWGAKFLSLQDKDGRWANALYSPKWISTTYTMLLLKRFGLEPTNPQAQLACQRLLDEGFYVDGGINCFASLEQSEICVTGMFLSLLAYFQFDDERIYQLVDYLLRQTMPDGGWNCWAYQGAHHSSLHTTISVLEGLAAFKQFSDYKQTEITEAQNKAYDFLLIHKLYKSDKTGEVIDARMTRFSFPPRWHYDVLRALDYFQSVHFPYDARLEDALDLLKKKQKQGRWPLQNKHPGRTYFEMEKVSKPSRWNTLRALRVLKWFEPQTRVP